MGTYLKLGPICQHADYQSSNLILDDDEKSALTAVFDLFKYG